MKRKVTAECIVEALQSFTSDIAFNPYCDICEIHDHAKSAEIRSDILYRMLERAEMTEVDAIWIGRDLGFRGGRRTGLALTDDVRFSAHLARWQIDAQRPTSGPPVAERTASMVWDYLDQISANVFLWNVFPCHPHASDDAFSNRMHNARERKFGEIILKSIFDLLEPKRIIAIGNDAAKVSIDLFSETQVHHVRHPSYGGLADFSSAIVDIYSVRRPEKEGRLI